MADVHALYARLGRRFRARRMARFARAFAVTERTRVLDVGGTAAIWSLLPRVPSVTLVNLRPAEPASLPLVVADARRLPFPDRSFDVVFANSLIDHLGTLADQATFAEECRRVGRGYWVQSPSRHFPIEPHYLTPFVHWLPRSWRRRVLPFTVWGLLTRPSPAAVDRMVGEVRMLTGREMRRLFPDARILRERVLGLTKSVVAVKVPERQPARSQEEKPA